MPHVSLGMIICFIVHTSKQISRIVSLKFAYYIGVSRYVAAFKILKPLFHCELWWHHIKSKRVADFLN